MKKTITDIKRKQLRELIEAHTEAAQYVYYSEAIGYGPSVDVAIDAFEDRMDELVRYLNRLTKNESALRKRVKELQPSVAD